MTKGFVHLAIVAFSVLIIHTVQAGFMDKLNKIVDTVDTVDNTVNRVDGTASKATGIKDKMEDRLTTENQKKVNRWNKSLAGTAERVQRACGKKISISLDSSLHSPFIDAAKEPNQLCSQAANTLSQHFCIDDKLKAGIKDQIESIKCDYDSSAKDKVKLKFKGSTLVVSITPDTPNIYDSTIVWLQDRL